MKEKCQRCNAGFGTERDLSCIECSKKICGSCAIVYSKDDSSYYTYCYVCLHNDM